jgi:tetratricopeptide (TPR) repeat protein
MLFLALLALLIGSEDDRAVKAQQAKQAMAARDFDRAIALYRDLNRAVPGDQAVQQNLGLALYSAGRYAESTSVLNQTTKDWHSEVDSVIPASATFPNLELFPLCRLLWWSPSPPASKHSFWRNCVPPALGTC